MIPCFDANPAVFLLERKCPRRNKRQWPNIRQVLSKEGIWQNRLGWGGGDGGGGVNATGDSNFLAWKTRGKDYRL